MMKKRIIYTVLLLCVSIASFAQAKKIEFKVEKQPNKLVVHGLNNTDAPLEITLTISDIKMLKGYTKPITKVVPANGKVLFIEMSYTYDFYKYKLSYTYNPVGGEEKPVKKAINKEDYYLKDVSRINDGIVVFDDEGCGNCRTVINFLVDNKLDFKIISIANNQANQKLLWKTVKEKGASLKIKLPVIVVNGELSHSHKDIQGFLKTLK